MSSKSARRKAEYQKREAKRQLERDRQAAIRKARRGGDIEALAAALGVPLK